MNSKRLTALILSFLLVISGILSINSTTANAIELTDGEYTIENDAFKMDEDKDSTARKYLEKQSKIIVKDGKLSLVLNFTGKSMMKDHRISINDKSVDFNILNETDETLEINFSIDSLKDKIVVATKIVLPFMTMDVEFRVVLEESTIEGEGLEKPETPEVPDAPETPETSPVEPEGKPQPEFKPSINEIAQGVYSVSNEVISDSTIGYAAARDALNEKSKIEVTKDSMFVTLGFGATDLMSNIRVYINGSKVNYTIENSNLSNNTMDIKFKISSLDSNIKVKAYIGMIERDIDFGVKFIKNTMVLLNGGTNSPLGKPAVLFKEDKDNTKDEKEQNKEEQLDEEDIEVKSYMKKYTIKNNVVKDSAVGKSMARKYLAETSILEEVDGKYYLTLEFSGTNVIEDFKIHINGKEVEYNIVKNDEENNIKAFRFELESLDDDIQIYCFINIMKMNIDFGVTLDKETMILIEDVSSISFSSATENKENKLLKAGIIILIIMVGSLILVYFIKIKKKKKIS